MPLSSTGKPRRGVSRQPVRRQRISGSILCVDRHSEADDFLPSDPDQCCRCVATRDTTGKCWRLLRELRGRIITKHVVSAE